MRVVIDLQGAQTESRFRGIGRYTLSFAQAVCRHRGSNDVILALNGLFPDSIDSIRAAFQNLLPQDNIRVWNAPGPVRADHAHNRQRSEVAELVREAFLASLHPDVIHISSLFEGYVDDAVTSIGRFDRHTPVTVALYDLIPLLNPNQYLASNPRYHQFYLQKIEYLNQAASCLAISEFARQEGLQHLRGFVPERICNVSTGLDPHFRVLEHQLANATELCTRFSLQHPFVFYTGGADDRKNLPRLIEAYAALPHTLRQNHQLLLAGRMTDGVVAQFKQVAKMAGLAPEEMGFTGYVTDEELTLLYNLCTLFVFPSWHEGFGLPALEAMACGAPVIGANASSVPEVIGLEEALFNPYDTVSMTAKIAQALQNTDFRQSLRAHGLQQSQRFSWNDSAQRAWRLWQGLPPAVADHVTHLQPAQPKPKPRLALVTPLPPERTGIADYGAALLPALARHYDIEIVIHQPRVDASCVHPSGRFRDADWLRANARTLDHVVYQMGNSPYHSYMLELLDDVPGTVILHDFYLSGLIAWLETDAGSEHAWTEALYCAHGYGAVQEKFLNAEAAKVKYPVNFKVLRRSNGVIVHSNHARELADQWYGEDFSQDWRVIPLLRTPEHITNKQEARQHLGIRAEDFVVCSFGFLDPSKFNHRLINAWISSLLATDRHCKLVFVGQNHGGAYGAQLLKTIEASGLAQQITITGYVSSEQYQLYLSAADAAVQLRALSRGETSAAVLDCMNHGLPVVVNANGSMAELSSDAVWMLPDAFEDTLLRDALEVLWRDGEKRDNLGNRARAIIHSQHSPDTCANQYAEAIDHFYQNSLMSTASLLKAIINKFDIEIKEPELQQLSVNIADSLPAERPAKQLLLDITATRQNDRKTGIERVARALLLAFLKHPPAGYRVEPVYLYNAGESWSYNYARSYTLGLLECPTNALTDEPVEPQSGDILLGLDLSGDQLIKAEESGLIAKYRNLGVSTYFTVFDLLPIQMPEVFPPDSEVSHVKWLKAVSSCDGAICISKSVAQDLAAWQVSSRVHQNRRRPFRINWAHLGADLLNTDITKRVQNNAEALPSKLTEHPTFLMVGTIEPRKAYAQVLDAFNQLWQQGIKINLIIVGQEGWRNLPEDVRRDIPKTVRQLEENPEKNRHLFWMKDVSDESLEGIYQSSTCLLAASYGEGFGLPLIEAAHHGLPILARDIPVFREVAGSNASYFQASSSEEMASEILKWLMGFSVGKHQKSDTLSWLTWSESAIQFSSCFLEANE